MTGEDARSTGRHGTGRHAGSRYRLLDVLGHGAAGVVHLAYDRRHRRYVAAKVLQDPRTDELTRLRFLAEQNLTVAHPCVVAVLDWYQAPGTAVLVTELADAGNLDELVALNPTLPVDLVEQIARDTLSGLAHLHDSGVTHRDVKPANILLRRAGAGVGAMIGDLGVALAAGRPRLTQDDTVVGTLGHLAPEVLASGQHTVRSDLWALGRTLESILARADAPVAGPLVEVVATMTATDPDHRPESAADALSRLGAPPTLGAPPALASPADPTRSRTAPPVRLPDRATTAIRRRRTAKRTRAFAVTATAMLAAGIVGSRALDDTPASAGAGTTGEHAAEARVGGTSVTRPTDVPPVTDPPTTTPATEDATTTSLLPAGTALAGFELPQSTCDWFDTVSLELRRVISRRTANYTSGVPADQAYGYGYGYGDVAGYVTQFREVGSMLTGQEFNLAVIGEVDDELSRGIVVQWLASAAPGGAAPPAAIDLADRLLASAPPSIGATRGQAVRLRLEAIARINERLEVGGCANAYPRPPRMSSAEAEIVFGTPIDTLDELYRRFDLVRAG